MNIETLNSLIESMNNIIGIYISVESLLEEELLRPLVENIISIAKEMKLEYELTDNMIGKLKPPTSLSNIDILDMKKVASS